MFTLTSIVVKNKISVLYALSKPEEMYLDQFLSTQILRGWICISLYDKNEKNLFVYNVYTSKLPARNTETLDLHVSCLMKIQSTYL